MDWESIEIGKRKWVFLALVLTILAIAGCESKVGPSEEAKDEQVKVIVVGGTFPILGSLSRVSIAPRASLFIGWNFNLEGIKSYAVSVGRYDGAGSYQPVWLVYNIPPTESGLNYSQRIPVGAVSSNSPPDLLDGDYRVFIDAYDQEFESSNTEGKRPIGRGGVTLLVGRGGFPNPDGNGTLATALPIGFNKSISSDIEQIYEIDVYSLDLAASQKVTVGLTNLTDNLNLVLYDFNGRELASAQRDGVLSRSMSFSASTAATYYLKVLGEVTAVGIYELTAEDENDTFETADEIKPSTPLDGQINPPGDLDYYSINLSAKEAMTFLLARLGSDLDLTLYDKNKAKVKESKDNNLVIKEERINFAASESGTFYLEVKGYKSARGAYTIEARR